MEAFGSLAEWDQREDIKSEPVYKLKSYDARWDGGGSWHSTDGRSEPVNKFGVLATETRSLVSASWREASSQVDGDLVSSVAACARAFISLHSCSLFFPVLCQETVKGRPFLPHAVLGKGRD